MQDDIESPQPEPKDAMPEVPLDDKGKYTPVRDENGKISWARVFTTEEAKKRQAGKKPHQRPIDATPPKKPNLN